MEFLLYECTRDRISPPENVHESYKNDDTLRYTLPLFITNRQMDKEEGGKEKKI